MAASWADTQLGVLAMQAFSPRFTLTLDLDVHLFDEVTDLTRLRTAARIVKAGSTVVVALMEFTTDDGRRRVGFSHGTFMAAPNPALSAPTATQALASFRSGRRPLDEPIVTRVGCTRTKPGEAVMPYASKLNNGSNAINGGLLTVAVEEAALSADPEHRPLESMHVRYLRAVRVGPAVARAVVRRGVGQVELRDLHTDAPALLATTRTVRG